MVSPFRKVMPLISVVAIAAMVLTACSPTTTTGATPTASVGNAPTAVATTVLGTTRQPSATGTAAPAKGTVTASGTGTPPAPAATPAGGPTTGGTAVPSNVPVKNPDTLIEATIGDPESLDPAWAYDTASGEVIFNVYETLVFPKGGSGTDMVPMLAEK